MNGLANLTGLTELCLYGDFTDVDGLAHLEFYPKPESSSQVFEVFRNQHTVLIDDIVLRRGTMPGRGPSGRRELHLLEGDRGAEGGCAGGWIESLREGGEFGHRCVPGEP